jgi:hypothetical protein
MTKMAKAALLAAMLLVGLTHTVGGASASAAGVSRDQLEAHSWTCVPFAPANRWSCFNDGAGRPFPGNPDPAPSYTFLAFDMTSGAFLYTGHLVRGDLYQGQPCAPGTDPYVYRAPIDYYECVRSSL